MKNACSFCENPISASQPCLSGQTPGNSCLRYMQLPPVGWLTFLHHWWDRKNMGNGPKTLWQHCPPSPVLCWCFPNPGARHPAQVKRSRPAVLPQAHSTSSAPLSEMLLKQERPHLDGSRDIGSALPFSGLCFCLFLAQVS